MATTLSHRILALPAELYNRIYFYVFTSESTTNYEKLDKSYRPPSCLQVSHASRAHFAPLYYSITVFAVQNQKEFVTWFKKLDKKHIGLLRGFRLIPRNDLKNVAMSTWHIDADDLVMGITDHLHAAKATAGWDLISVKWLEDFWAVDVRLVR
jgi:hypothetical protein